MAVTLTNIFSISTWPICPLIMRRRQQMNVERMVMAGRLLWEIKAILGKEAQSPHGLVKFASLLSLFRALTPLLLSLNILLGGTGRFSTGFVSITSFISSRSLSSCSTHCVLSHCSSSSFSAFVASLGSGDFFQYRRAIFRSGPRIL